MGQGFKMKQDRAGRQGPIFETARSGQVSVCLEPNLDEIVLWCCVAAVTRDAGLGGRMLVQQA